MSGLSTTPDSCIRSRRSADAANVFARLRSCASKIISILLVLSALRNRYFSVRLALLRAGK